MNGDIPGVNISRLEIIALQEQTMIFPFKSKIEAAIKAVLKNLEEFLDISKGIRKYHLTKAQQVLPNIFRNMIDRNGIKKLLKNDIEETNRNLAEILAEVQKKTNAVERIK